MSKQSANPGDLEIHVGDRRAIRSHLTEAKEKGFNTVTRTRYPGYRETRYSITSSNRFVVMPIVLITGFILGCLAMDAHEQNKSSPPKLSFQQPAEYEKQLMNFKELQIENEELKKQQNKNVGELIKQQHNEVAELMNQKNGEVEELTKLKNKKAFELEQLVLWLGTARRRNFVEIEGLKKENARMWSRRHLRKAGGDMGRGIHFSLDQGAWRFERMKCEEEIKVGNEIATELLQ